MNDKIQEAFGQIHAEESLKQSTREYLRKNAEKRRTPSFPVYKYLLSATACLFFTLTAFGGYQLYFTPVSVISIDINPSMEWNINRFGRVISVENYNTEAQDLSAQLDVTHKNYASAVDLLIQNPTVKQYISKNEYLTFTVAGKNEIQTESILEIIHSRTQEIRNAQCTSANYADLTAAHEAGLSCGKYKAYLILRSLDRSVTPAEVQQMTMKEIRERVNSLSGNDTDDTDESSSSVKGNHGTGNGAGGVSSGKGNAQNGRKRNSLQ